MNVKDKELFVFESKSAAGLAAGKLIEESMLNVLKEKPYIRMIFAAAPSQNEVLSYLVNSSKIPWNRVIAFNMDEYIGLPDDAPQLFSRYLKDQLFSKVKLAEVNLINPAVSEEQEIRRYADLLTKETIDIVVLGIGQNGHIAFNDPPVADFQDPKVIKSVELDLICRQQQVTDQCFNKLEEVPKNALTLTIPTIMRGEQLFCIVSGKHKAKAVYETFTGEISTKWPSSILNVHPNCKFFIDQEAYSLLEN